MARLLSTTTMTRNALETEDQAHDNGTKYTISVMVTEIFKQTAAKMWNGRMMAESGSYNTKMNQNHRIYKFGNHS